MAYADFQAHAAYVSKQPGAAVGVVLYDEDDPSKRIVGAVTQFSARDDFEVVPVEEAGNEGIDEAMQGRHSGSGSFQTFWTAEWNDALLSRQQFLGRGFTVLEVGADDRDGVQGQVLNAYTGVKIQSLGTSHGARGGKMIDGAFMFEWRYSGAEWSALTGS